MSLIDLFRKHAESLSGNPGNPNENARVTATGHDTQGGNPGNPSNPEINRDKVLIEKSQTKKGGAYCYRTSENPKAVLVMVAPESDLQDAWDELRQKYGDRLIEVFVMPGTQH
ncbi:MAG: hypothetical protein Q7U18_13725 [Methylobacter sp.]|nr:hypothetical protein [Methylobacter sp.]